MNNTHDKNAFFVNNVLLDTSNLLIASFNIHQ